MPKAYLLVAGDFVKTGGMDRANHALAFTLATRGAEVHLVGYRADEELLAFSNVHFHRVPKIVGSYLLSAPLLDRIGRKWARRLTAQGGRVIVNGANCHWGDVNWVHFVHAAYHAEGRASWLQAWKQRRHRKKEKAIIPRSPVVITTTDRNKSDLLAHLQIRGSQVHVISLGIDPDLFRPASAAERAAARQSLRLPPTGPVVAFIGSPRDPRKGFDTLLKAWTELTRDPQWDAHLAVAGRGTEGMSAARQVHYLGFVAGAQTLLAASDALVAPSRYEPYSIAAHEALSCGLPVFITALSGIAGLYPKSLRHFLLEDPESVGELTARLRAWRNDPEGHHQQVAAFGERLRSFTWRDMADAIIALVDRSTSS